MPFTPPDHDAGDANTIGGYRAVHGRPVAFEGRDGAAYSVEVVTDETGERGAPFGAYLLFVRWREGDPVAAGHVETPFLARGPTEGAAAAALGAMRLSEVRRLLDDLLAHAAAAAGGAEPPPPPRPWWDVMRDA